MNMVVFRLMTAGALPVLTAILFIWLEKRPRWQAMTYGLQQAVIGVAFGALAVLGTEFGIPVEGAVINVRNAAPLTASLVFGWPAGVIAGVIGGVERWLATLWGVGEFTRLACSLATILAGLIGAVVRMWLLNKRSPGWFHGLALGMVTEVLHMLLVFLTNASDVQRAFTVVRICALPMILSNSLSVMMATGIALCLREKKVRRRGIRRISQIFERQLLICVVIAFIITTMFTANLQTQLAMANTKSILQQNLSDVQASIQEASDMALLDLTERVYREIPENADGETLRRLAAAYEVTEINIVDKNGVITTSTNPEFEGYRMDSGEQSAYFMCLLDGIYARVQAYQPIAADPTISRKYAGVAMEEGFVQVGYDAVRFQNEINGQVSHAAHNRHVGQSGFILICDSKGDIISDDGSHTGQNIQVLGHKSNTVYPEKEVFQATVLGVDAFIMYLMAEGYAIMALLPADEALFYREAAIYIIAFMEIVVFAALFTYVYHLIRRLIVKDIHKINRSLYQIAQGNLNVTVNVRGSEEFSALSNDINTTVDALRKLIDDAAARIDRELEVAKQIQLSALPSVFLPHASRAEYDIYGSMHTAREVGGDFYDFYLVDDHTLVMTIADVSDKGIPAAMFMMQAKALLKSSTETGMPLDEVFNMANRRLREGNDANMFVTVWSIRIDLRTGHAEVANAGHNPPVLCPEGQPCRYHRTRAGLVLAASDRIRYRQTELQLNPGDVLFLYTDGITEATNAQQELYGEERLLALMDTLKGLPPEEICRRVKENVDAFVGNAPQYDDMTMLALRYRGGVTVNEWTWPARISSIPAVTEAVEEQLNAVDCPPGVQARINIAVDELFSNIARYAYPDGGGEATVRMETQKGRMSLTFEDGGTPYNPLEREAPDTHAPLADRSEGGLGIYLVKKTMDEMTYELVDGRNILKITKTW